MRAIYIRFLPFEKKSKMGPGLLKNHLPVVFSLLCFFLQVGSAFGATEANIAPKPSLLVVLGYVDYGSPKNMSDVVAGRYNYPLAKFLHDALISEVAPWLEKVEAPGFIRRYENERVAISLLSVNELCSEEEVTSFSVRRVQPCERQVLKSKAVQEFLLKHARSFDEIIYLGHARGGQGFALGPPVPEFTFNILKLGFVKKLMMIACSSQSYYGWYANQVTPSFVGLAEEDTAGLDQLLLLVINEMRAFMGSSTSTPREGEG